MIISNFFLLISIIYIFLFLFFKSLFLNDFYFIFFNIQLFLGNHSILNSYGLFLGISQNLLFTINFFKISKMANQLFVKTVFERTWFFFNSHHFSLSYFAFWNFKYENILFLFRNYRGKIKHKQISNSSFFSFSFSSVAFRFFRLLYRHFRNICKWFFIISFQIEKIGKRHRWYFLNLLSLFYLHFLTNNFIQLRSKNKTSQMLQPQ